MFLPHPFVVVAVQMDTSPWCFCGWLTQAYSARRPEGRLASGQPGFMPGCSKFDDSSERCYLPNFARSKDIHTQFIVVNKSHFQFPISTSTQMTNRLWTRGDTRTLPLNS